MLPSHTDQMSHQQGQDFSLQLNIARLAWREASQEALCRGAGRCRTHSACPSSPTCTRRGRRSSLGKVSEVNISLNSLNIYFRFVQGAAEGQAFGVPITTDTRGRTRNSSIC